MSFTGRRPVDKEDANVALRQKKRLSATYVRTVREVKMRVRYVRKGEGINLISCDFEAKRRIIELLDIQVICMVDDTGKKIVDLKCILGSDQCGISTGIHGQTSDV
jgi:hypothetical protein